MSEKDKALKIDKKKKSLSTDVYTKTQPLRDCVSELVIHGDPTPEELAHVQGELRRLSRLVKKTRAIQA